MGRKVHIVSQQITPPPVEQPEWLTTPAPTFTEGVAGVYDLTQHLASGGVDRTITVAQGSLNPGVTLVDTDGNQRLVYDGVATATTVANVVLNSAPDPVDPPPDPPPVDPPDFNIETDWISRSRARGVFYATNCSERIQGARDEVNNINFTRAYDGFVGRQYLVETPATLSIPASEDKYPDGEGKALIEQTGGLSGGKCRTVRRVYRYSTDNDDDWNIKVGRFIPVDYTGGFESVPGQPNRRYDLQGVPRKYVETEKDPLLSGNQKLAVRHVYIQWAFRLDRAMAWQRQKNMITVIDRDVYDMNGASPGDWQNKYVFINGGYSTNQVFVGSNDKCGILGLKGTFGGSFRSSSSYYGPFNAVQSTDISFSMTNMDAGFPPIDASTPPEVVMQRHGPSATILSGSTVKSGGVFVEQAPMTGALPLPFGYNDRGQYITRTQCAELGISPINANSMSAEWRGFPFGGYSWNDRKIFPLLARQDETWASIMDPDKWWVCEVLVSEQYDAACNQGGQVTNLPDSPSSSPTKNPLYPRLVAMWVAEYGKPPVFHGWLGGGKDDPTGAIPSWWDEDCNTQFKWQDANSETVKEMGFIVVGAETPGCQNPTSSVFYAYNSNWARLPTSKGGLLTSYKYTTATSGSSGGGQFDWGKKDDVLGGCTLGFTSGNLTLDAYNPPVAPGLREQYQQAEIEKTEVVYDGGLPVRVVDPNPSANGALRYVHKVTLSAPLPIAPAIGDAGNVFCGNDKDNGIIYNIPGHRERRMSYTEVIMSCDPIPFPGHPNTPLPRPYLP